MTVQDSLPLSRARGQETRIFVVVLRRLRLREADEEKNKCQARIHILNR